MRGDRVLAERSREAVVVAAAIANGSTLSAINAESRIPFRLSPRRAGPCCAATASVPAGRRIAGLSLVAGRDDYGLNSQQFGKIFLVDRVDFARAPDTLN